MARIVYRKGISGFRDGDVPPAFLVEGIEEEAVFLRLKIALLETKGAQRIGEASDFEGLAVSYENILALEATGFAWDGEAAVQSVSVLSALIQERRSEASGN
ncbi:MAG: hypothetical protein V4671_00470 [Armatimonadota bacterium]